MADLSELATLGKTPIPGEKPAGESVQFDPDYEAMRAELQKLDSVNQESVHWSMVVDTGADILKNRSKHLLVATSLSLALLERDGYPGLTAGLTICRDLVAGFWETMEPPVARKRGRIEAISWLAERAGKAAAARRPSAGEMESLAAGAALMKEIEAAVRDKLGDDAPGFGELERVVKQHIAEAAAAIKAAEARKAQAAKVASGEIDETTSAEDARKILTTTRTTIKKITDILRKTDPADPVPYRLIRAVTWGTVKDLPPNTKGTTQLPAPAPELAARLNDLHSKGEWANLIDAAEAAFGNAIFWLDLHRWTAQGLGGLGGNYARAQRAVTGEVAALLARMPEIADLQFANGTPLASKETEAWLTSDVRRLIGGESDQETTPTDGMPEGLLEATKDAKKAAARGQLGDAVRMMQQGIAGAGLQRSQFLWRLELARLFLDSGQPAMAAPLLEELEGQIQEHHLEVWEPQLCLTAYMALFTARRTLLKDQRRVTPELTQKTNLLYERLCRLDPGAALTLDGK
ncbi:MAG: type VI secretion system protein TssA [candidate division Zixibacteria bacterium]|nr:type VI secretion system protein TssA [candidate division Zixibacteria bacterium]